MPITTEQRQRRLALQETGTDYSNNIPTVLTGVPDFWKIYEHNVGLLPRTVHYTTILTALASGTAIINDQQMLSNYLACYGGLHYHKLQTSFDTLFQHLASNATVDIIDYGCGQTLATTVFYDYLIRNNKNVRVDNIVLIEPSDIAIKRGILHLNYFIAHRQQNAEITKLNSVLDNISADNLSSNSTNIKIHLLSNILDVIGFDIVSLTDKIKSSQRGINYFICVSPYNTTSQERITVFQNSFVSDRINCPSSAFTRKAFVLKNNRWEDDCKISMVQRIFKCNFDTRNTRQNHADDLPF